MEDPGIRVRLRQKSSCRLILLGPNKALTSSIVRYGVVRLSIMQTAGCIRRTNIAHWGEECCRNNGSAVQNATWMADHGMGMQG